MFARHGTTLWKVQPGPSGRGDCLTKRKPNGETLIIAPPGVPLAPPEAVADLLCWRTARWSNGKLAAAPKRLTFNDVLGRAPEQRSWLDARFAEVRRRDGMVELEQQPWGRTGLVAPGGNAEETRRPVALARSASTFARVLGQSEPAAPAKRIAQLVNACAGRDEFRAQVAGLEAQIGAGAVREALIAVLCARARSHSWRYTQAFDPRGWWTDRDINRQLHEEAALAVIAPRVAREPGVRGGVTASTAELIDVLQARSQTRRWRWTAPIRREFASPRWREFRRVLRERAQPRLEHAHSITDLLRSLPGIPGSADSPSSRAA